MNSIASKVWETLYPDRRPWDQLPEATQQEWSRMVDIVVDLTGARELREACEMMIIGICAAAIPHPGERATASLAVSEARKALARAKEVLG